MAQYELISFVDDRALAQAAASAWLDDLASQRDVRETYCVALSGGRIARGFFSAVAAVVARGSVREDLWSEIHFFWADERCVPPDDAESNYRIARELLFTPLNAPPERIHRLRGEDAVEFAVTEGETELCRIAPMDDDGQPVLDLILLGMGEDGHVASLFPGETDKVMASKRVYRAVVAAKPPPNRITLGYGVIAAAKQVWVLASGVGKETALHESLRPEGGTPLARVLRSRNHTRIFTDVLCG